MVQRDKSHGHGFVYVDIAKLLKQVEQVRRNPEIHPQERDVKSIHFPKHEVTK